MTENEEGFFARRAAELETGRQHAMVRCVKKSR